MCELCDRGFNGPYERLTPAARELGLMLSDDDHWNAWHIVVEDGNIEDEHIEHCLRNSISEHEKQIGALFLSLSEEQRISALALHDGYITEDH